MILVVTEKNDAAQQIARLLSTGGKPKADKVYDTPVYRFTVNGEDCDTERFRLLYRFLLYIYGEELYIGEVPEGEPDAQVHLTTQNGKEDYTIAFYKISDLKTIVARDGVPSYVIRTSALDTLSYNLSIFDDASKESKEKALITDGEKIMELLRNREGKMPYSDESSPEVIRDKFGISKAAFKRALGHLLRENRIVEEDGWTYLKEN